MDAVFWLNKGAPLKDRARVLSLGLARVPHSRAERGCSHQAYCGFPAQGQGWGAVSRPSKGPPLKGRAGVLSPGLQASKGALVANLPRAGQWKVPIYREKPAKSA